MAINPEQVRLTVLTKLQEAFNEEAILAEQILALMHRFADRFTDRRVEINNLMVLHDHPLIDYAAKEHGRKATTDDELQRHVKALLLNTSLLTIQIQENKKIRDEHAGIISSTKNPMSGSSAEASQRRRNIITQASKTEIKL
ncbi:hypothetical protein Tco_0615707 [Tanacetum coccineum]